MPSSSPDPEVIRTLAAILMADVADASHRISLLDTLVTFLPF